VITPAPVVHCTCGAALPRESFLRRFFLYVGADERTGVHEFARMGTCPRCKSTVTIEFWTDAEASVCRVCARGVAGTYDDPKIIVDDEVWCRECALESIAVHPFLARAKYAARARTRVA
jgi:hypothetical protein